MIKALAVILLAVQSSWAIRTEFDSIHNQKETQAGAEMSVPSGTVSILRAGVFQSTGNTTIGDAAADLMTIHSSSLTLINATTFYAPLNVTISGDITLASRTVMGGNTVIGDAAADLLSVNPSSITLPNATTIYANADLTILYSSPTVCSTFIMEPGQGRLVRSSPTAQAANVTPTFEVVNLMVDSSTIKGVFLKSLCTLNQDGGADAASISLYLRQTGSAGVAATRNQSCTVGAELASESGRDFNFGFYPSTGPIDFSCESGGVTGARRCDLFYMGACR